MAIGWLGAVKAIPWTDVVANAPDIIRGAKRLWKMVRRSDPVPAKPDEAGHGDRIAALERRVEALEVSESRTREEATEIADLISSLAGQNAELVKAVDMLGRRTRILAGMSALLVVAVFAIGLAVIFVRP